MSESTPAPGDRSYGHIFPKNDGPFIYSAEDIARAAALPEDACPRRYCFHWDSPSFHWERTPKEGCLFLTGKKVGWIHAGIPCCRSDASSIIDQFDPNDLSIEADGVDATKWENSRLENQRLTLPMLPEQQDEH